MGLEGSSRKPGGGGAEKTHEEPHDRESNYGSSEYYARVLTTQLRPHSRLIQDVPIN
jgi:hypothetical protein